MKPFSETYRLPLFEALVNFTDPAGFKDDAPVVMALTPFVDDAIDEAVTHASQGHDAWVIELTADGWRELHRYDPRDYDESLGMMEAAE